MKRVTQAELARRLGVSVMTVSLALRNSPRLPQETRERVRATAERLGYRPDPALSALVNHRREGQISSDWSTLAFVTDWAAPDAWRSTYVGRIFLGARERAEQTGYRLEPFWLGEYRTQTKASRVLNARGVRGLLLAPQPQGNAHLRLNWELFSAVAIGATLVRPMLHRVMHDYHASMAIAMHELRHRGYRKVALVLNERTEQITGHRVSAMFTSECARHSLSSEGFTIIAPAANGPEVLEQLRRDGADCVLSLHAEVYSMLLASGLKIPEDIGYASLHIPVHLPDLSGIDYGAYQLGVTAVDRVNTMIQRNELGPPEWPLNITVPGRWREGVTLCASREDTPKTRRQGQQR